MFTSPMPADSHKSCSPDNLQDLLYFSLTVPLQGAKIQG